MFYIIILKNSPHRGNTLLMKVEEKQKSKLITQTINFINHNFTIFYDNTNKFFLQLWIK